MAHLQLPTSGNLEGEGVVPYDANSENTEKIKKGDYMNPQEDPEAGSKVLDGVRTLTDSPQNQHSGSARPESRKTDMETPKGPAEPSKPKHERQLSQEEGDLRRTTDSPLQHESAGRKSPLESPLHRNAGETPRRASRQSDRSLEVSPLHPHSHARLGGKGSGVSSPSWERKGSSEGGRGIAPSTPARSRLRPVAKVDDTPDNSPVVPKFGDWDDNDPASAEQFTQVFDRVRDDKLSGAGKVPALPGDASYSNSERQYRKENAKGCSCFPWLRK
ncbi:PREDICTED: RPM1-interacting protein 4-like isoform X2 [Ipomoea nil]|uniref:RPM1-interacting protein 4-like isoform X2 n=1 Tax=Ipomoea nil TaxID=35883 RepID=UPI000900CF63|nr:PREDICTED: RPM1-interacting protein 4-like isoform X2 [Ipomoea nil]